MNNRKEDTDDIFLNEDTKPITELQVENLKKKFKSLITSLILLFPSLTITAIYAVVNIPLLNSDLNNLKNELNDVKELIKST
ncbi:uncharacterized protein KGF55_001610 [Candida pseudojiufengensis]|uniref:uncharacterized protein n=1 Tax=Candida pseudojiufengensis TaxID=497109 RepID=UPI00222516C4|nr:uncharacterized protein KGF55_001610 [Candida pseudojiufengensis]KAI5965389.1 hypothetical protein KGF55_001610 [Candida pseudojiufengensis]